ncbi:FtsX-like permease family protein [Maridesulfovibrio sp.]|uniref:ABC transporter permease n=1 Tax=Maridesulfovibrio sp. TaxID=2795000 RepID=UPI002AA6A285|nr:FtsX-like permease family protein [Maridesulfovibrio sp.]
MLLVSLALRNIMRNKRRSFLTISAMVLSSAMLLLAIGVSAGKMHDMLASATDQYYGHIVISGNGYQKSRSIFTNFQLEPEQLKILAGLDFVKGYSPRLRGFGLLCRKDNSLPVEALGIRPEMEKNVTVLQDSLVAGKQLGNDPDGVLLGEGLARKLGVSPGDDLAFVSGASDGSVGNGILVVKGIFRTGNFRNDNELILLNLDWLQETLVLPDTVHSLAVSVQNPMQAKLIAAKLQNLFGNRFEVLDWSSFLPEIRDAIAISYVTNIIVMTIFYLATGLGIFNTFYMSVMERSYEFGILMALGTRPWQIRLLVLLETFFMGVIAVTLGVGLGLGINIYLQKVGIDLSGSVEPITYAGGTILPRIHASIDFFYQISAALFLLFVCIAAGFLPANRAAKLNPVQVIRGD